MSGTTDSPARVAALTVIIVTAWLHAGSSAMADTGATSGPALGGGDITVSTLMAPGSLVISVPLRQPALTSKLQPITVTDNRTEDPGWTVTVILTSHETAGLTWNPDLLSAAPGESVILGPKTGPRPSLQQPRTLASTQPGASLGTALLSAALYPSGSGAATFTLTAI
ncbi:hypothetical protein Caci_0450 [Catenulispora acidiphila DSM 44928]|uniref:Uncharacterized protein n=1 Tax=Catenulispora acidiphila (strain DSM 44928 / JCM 14897 / NBRC 102108 / NRRL B-24433 / ID139908) TaxID=479433 RepID=C7PX51_CATAD|nr:hypothetical protein [Catenulispora acidiphila]ACU69402.1 hypothetical protein Caci_0450 [Catenulispora acidiphila DSM 44928]